MPAGYPAPDFFQQSVGWIDENGKPIRYLSVTSTNTRVVSADGKTMTIEQKSTDANGRPVDNVMLFERQ